jgi:hypothetical protein
MYLLVVFIFMTLSIIGNIYSFKWLNEWMNASNNDEIHYYIVFALILISSLMVSIIHCVV